LHSHVFVLASLLHIKIYKKHTWAHEGPHISENPKKKWAHEVSYIILEFAASGMCETNLQEEINKDLKANKFQG
jgi:hypothetical protein